MSTTTRSALDLVGKLAGASKAKKNKSDKPVIELPELATAAEDFLKYKAQEETAKALKEAAKDQLLAAAGPERLMLCVSAGTVIASVGIVAGETRLTMTQTSKYSAVAEERAAAVKAAFGDDSSRYFADTLQIALNEDAANSEAVLAELLEKVGPAFFSKHFAVRRDLLVTDAFHHAFCTDTDVQATARPFIAEQTIKPYSPSFKQT